MASLFLDPNGNGTTQDWTTPDYTNVDNGVRDPASGTGSGEAYSATEDQVCEWTMDDCPATAGDTTCVNLWLWTDQTEPKSANIKWDGVWQTAETSWDSPNGNDWNRYVFVLVDDISAGVTNIEARVTAGAGGDDRVEAAYIEVVYTSDLGNPWNYYAQQGGI